MEREEIEARVTELCRAPVEASGYELWLVEWSSDRGRAVLRLTIDRPGGVDLRDCVEVSRLVGGLLDAYDVIPGGYNLEVSSPGLDRRLVRPEHFQRFLGQLVQVRMAEPVEGRRNFKGRLLEADENAVVLDVDGGQVRLSLAGVEKANVVPEW